ncbi:hypothetical protein [Polaromonas sp.]|uniref:hypothetical protein n=1 Tax=Polaromonas sp. TaxID=1869339 RepID=UPI003BB6F85A
MNTLSFSISPRFGHSTGFSLLRTLRGSATVLVAATTVLTGFANARELGNSAQQSTKKNQTVTPAPAAASTAAVKAATSTASGRIVPSPIYGVTIDDISGLSNITQSLGKLSKKPTTRIVFDENVAPSYYRDATVAINKVSYVMGEILDSQYVDTVTVPGYLDRTSQYLGALGDVVDIWEIGNEINGEWLGNNADVVAKMSGAYDLVKSQNKTAALTLYYNQDCWSKPANEMFTWANANVPSRMKQGLDYVFISYYEADCNGLKPNWPVVFQKLATMFPNSKIGFGEVGTATRTQKADYLTRYYTMKIDVPKYVGGHFWWYFRQDMVPSTKPLLNTLNSAISAP